MSLVKLLKKRNKKLLFTTPSHSQSFVLYNPLKSAYKIDISETDAHNPTEALSKAQERAKKIYKTKSTLFLTNGSTSGVIASVLTCVNKGDNVLIWKNSHPCHANAVRLAGAEPIFYDLEIDDEWGIPLELDPEIIEHYFKAYEIKALIVTSPTYEGIVSDIKKIKKICEKYNVYLIVDEAHGALYPFSKRLPDSAVNIADFTVQSLHKTAGGLNPTALLHTMTDLDIKKSLSMINTTSPSYPILASIEENINFLNSWWGKRKLEQLIDELEILQQECTNCEFFGDDITKILVKVDGISGEELSNILFKTYNIEDEKTNEKSTMLLCGIGTDKKKIKHLKNALLNL
ncbi:MAG: aminotransferase class I/II-fold pyridoxal phosphate-dependent enzyme [Cyanobacteria bacterium SIG32]|nr:aminotransferase class I/II-fold pyridoxal phosphate-dependent enzyme [Cyanobacteria bacterium SIG32]